MVLLFLLGEGLLLSELFFLLLFENIHIVDKVEVIEVVIKHLLMVLLLSGILSHVLLLLRRSQSLLRILSLV